MAQNILVCKNYRVRDHSKWHRDRTKETHLVDSYNQMQRLMLGSARSCVEDLDQVIVHGGEAETIRDVFREHFWEIHELWKTGANILYCDLDVLFVRPVKYFGQFHQFAMFNYTQPPRCRDAHYGVTFDHYFNCGIRYYPHNMDSSVWELGIQMLENWDADRWDCEQVIYNAMMWHQQPALTDVLRPELNYQMLRDPRTSSGAQEASNFNGGMPYSQACAIHFHGSRNAEQTAAIMEHVQSLLNSEP
jgi:hypothetical protein